MGADNDGGHIRTEPDPNMSPALASTGELALWVKVFWVLVILGFAAAGGGAIKVYLDNNRQVEELEERGVEADANVTSVPEGSEGSDTQLRVSYDPPGPEILASRR